MSLKHVADCPCRVCRVAAASSSPQSPRAPACDPVIGNGCYVAHGQHVKCSCRCHTVKRVREELVDRILLAVFETHDGPALWEHGRRDPDAFRAAVLYALRSTLTGCDSRSTVGTEPKSD